MKEVQVTLPDEVWDILQKELKGKMGENIGEIIKSIVLAYLSEKGYMDKVPRGQRLQGAFLAPFGLSRVKRVVIFPRLPAVCSAVKHFKYFDDAVQEARKMKQQDPKGLYGYDYDPDKGAWAVIVCTQVPPGAKFTEDGLLIFPPIEKYEYERY